MKRLLIIFMLFCSAAASAQNSFQEWKAALPYDLHLLDNAEINALYRELTDCYKPLKFDKQVARSGFLDSMENARRAENILKVHQIQRILKNCKTANEYLKSGIDIYDLYNNSLDAQERIDRYREDSIVCVLALDCYKRAYRSAGDTDDAVNAIFEIGQVHINAGENNVALKLFEHALVVDTDDKILHCKLLWGYIRGQYSGKSMIEKDVAVRILPYYKEFVYLYLEFFADNIYNCILFLSELGYISKVAGEKNYIDYCRKAVNLANENEIVGLLFLKSVLTRDYYKSANVLLGDYYVSNGQYRDAAIQYSAAHMGINEDDFINVSPDGLYQSLDEYKFAPIYKQTVSYPLHMNKLAIVKYCLNNSSYTKYLNEAYYTAVRKLMRTFIGDVKNERDYLFNMYLPILVSQYNNPNTKWAYNAALFIKGATNNVELDIKKAFTNLDGSLHPEYLKYLSLQEQYQKNNSQFTLTVLQRQELKLSTLSPIFANYLQSLQYTYRDICNTVAHNNICAVEFILTPTFDSEQNIYYALIINKNATTPIKMELCKEQELEQIFKEQYRAYSEVWSKKLYSMIWAKLEPYINEGDEVYFSPAGLLHQMNIEVTQDENGRLANEKYNLHRVSSTRELCIDRPEIERTSAVLYGGLEYNMDSETMLAQSRAYSRTDDYLATRGFDADSTQRGDLKFLPNSKTEIAAIGKYLKQHNIDYTSYTAQAGTEESFKALSGKRMPIIHLATHGFFFTNEQTKGRSFFDMFDMDNAAARPDNSLKRSGLILAGAQRAWNGEPIPDSVEDGILLADEIATMDLSGTDLVVLSACQTGLGEITSEGVFGLQRAFKKAGVQTLIMSLWKVDDVATQLMMTTFYEEWLSGKSKHEAFAIAQRTVRTKHPAPYYWASFIMLD